MVNNTFLLEIVYDVTYNGWKIKKKKKYTYRVIWYVLSLALNRIFDMQMAIWLINKSQEITKLGVNENTRKQSII